MNMDIEQSRTNNLIEYVRGVLNGENGKELYIKYRSDIEHVTPQEAFEVFNNWIENGKDPGEILAVLDKVLNVFYIEILDDSKSTEKDFNVEIGKLFFAMYGLVQKEELILFPAASEIISKDEWSEMYKQSMEYGFPFIQKPETVEEGQNNTVNVEGLFKTDTGELTFEQIMMIFNALPVDLTFVDENNKVTYFTRPKDRIFPRSPAIIGRDVEKCHPPESVHVVRKIVDAFKSGQEDSASFWINLKGKRILIQYFALRDSEGNYKGTLEVSQDITEIKALEGERRLLQ